MILLSLIYLISYILAIKVTKKYKKVIFSLDILTYKLYIITIRWIKGGRNHDGKTGD
ncbi:hypothetical protein TREAZ_0611 [Leadbettera azotonutricia ZAS-9]|uniref:Uncharacterized protein n=1 Tax=Leadbettera azotonutricia (strain ATCC BAA-888 / DSM 13862 / ZAS-9) TaxID=545695 RepID=F5YBH4_LEAAZ|nr:hypothetical protein TREAZ_0611 [Leadbettera azotonutricia ZAS-9]